LIYTAPLTLHGDVREDLQKIKLEDPFAHAKIAALVRQLQADRAIVEKLLDHGFGDDKSEEFSVNKWISVWKQGKDLWRLKNWDLEDQKIRYRIIYLYIRKEARFVIMAIVKRGDLDYDDENHPVRKRVLSSIGKSYGLV
jgi:hypothetical protein